MPSEYTAAQSALTTAFGGSLDTAGTNYQTIYTNFMNQRWGFMLTYDNYKSYEATLITNPSATLCNSILSAPPQDTLACIGDQLAAGVANGKNAYQAYIAEQKDLFRASYVSTCSAAGADVQLTAKQKIYHYTLYYYDQADNLVRTVPPEGVSLLNDDQLAWVNRVRNNFPPVCDYDGPPENSDKAEAFAAMPDVLNLDSAAMELWLYTDGTFTNHFVEASTQRNMIFQLSILNSQLAIDIYPMNDDTTGVTLKPNSIHYRADISSLLPLQPFTHVVLQGDSLGTRNNADLYVNGKKIAVTKDNTPTALGFTAGTSGSTPVMPDSLQSLKHLRLYSRPLSPAVILANANDNCLMPTDRTYLLWWFRFNTPDPGGPTTVSDSSTVETRLVGIFPNHRIATNYAYNSTNQVSTQNSPDGGTNRFWYDLLSRLVISQNDKQNPNHDYSYTTYDDLGRIKEAGQKNQNTIDIHLPDYLEQSVIDNFTFSGSNSQITNTYYDEQVAPGNGIQSLPQNNLRKRVAVSTYRATSADSVTQATYYDYDLDGNVKNLYQQIAGLGTKRINYEYDLISGKVNFVSYQNGKPDQFYYQYKYDADNRLTQAWASIAADTSTYGAGSQLDPAKKKLDATYQYYLHGPLARMELGDTLAKVQGVDYAYTLQGWLKGVNAQSLNTALDMGQDSARVAKDAYGYSLGYYHNDYKPIGGTTYAAFAKQYTQNSGDITGQDLFNGNISTSTYAISQINSGAPVGYTYHYDQLNRIKKLRQHNGINTWNNSNINGGYSEDFTYDGNGNILSLRRSGSSSTTLDTLKYQYNRDGDGNLVNNKLNYLLGHGAATHMGTDQYLNNYKYDPIGNMIYDRQDSITNINWTVYNKIESITDTGKTISYLYNTSQQRVTKTANSLTTYYVRDGQGNTLALYDNKSSHINWREQHLYGSSRLGMWLPNINLSTGGASAKWDTAGYKILELANHIGNVVATISDKRIAHTGFFTPDIITAQDYYAFGARMLGRAFTAGNTYPYGFNGKENDNEVKGIGNQQDYGKRIYDPRVGRFLSVDPIADKYPMLSSYQFASNGPIKFIDIDGEEATTIGVDIIAEAYQSSNGMPQFIDYSKAVLTVTGNHIAGAGDAVVNVVKGTLMFVPNLWKNTFNDIKNYQRERAQYIMHSGQEYEKIKQNGGDYNSVEINHKVRQASNGLKIASDYEDWFGLSVAGMEVSLTGAISMTIPRQLALDEIAGTLTNSEARQWYKKSISEIPNLLTKDAPLEIQAKEASSLRNEFRTEARKLMSDRLRARHIEIEYPNRSWEQLVKKYSNQGYRGDDLYKKIIEASQRSNVDIDKLFGL